MPNRNAFVISMLVTTSVGVSSLAATGAYDDASNSAYSSGWAAATATTSEGIWGDGWIFSTSGNAGRFVASSNNNDGGTGGLTNINTGGRAWGLYSNDAGHSYAERPFDGNLQVGQKFQIDMDNGDISSGKKVGFALLNSSGSYIFEYRFIGDDSHYSVYEGGTSTKALNDAGNAVPYYKGGLRITFELTGSSTYKLSVRQPTTSTTVAQYFRNLAGLAGTNISKVRLFNENSGWGDQYNVYFNSVSVPEPTTFTVLTGGVLLASLKRKRR